MGKRRLIRLFGLSGGLSSLTAATTGSTKESHHEKSAIQSCRFPVRRVVRHGVCFPCRRRCRRAGDRYGGTFKVGCPVDRASRCAGCRVFGAAFPARRRIEGTACDLDGSRQRRPARPVVRQRRGSVDRAGSKRPGALAVRDDRPGETSAGGRQRVGSHGVEPRGIRFSGWQCSTTIGCTGATMPSCGGCSTAWKAC
jgi:hypothetical protein